jgi:RHS repeat-associated protein
VRTGAGALWFRYPHRDHLGSIVALTDAGGALVERSGFDPWGKRTDFSTWNPPAPNTFVPGGSGAGGTTQAVTSTKRGYTGHEHVDQLGFVHMNGRIYDSELGKFFSADPTMQFPESTQGFNRYAYAGNNPLTNWDPSGFSFFKKLMKVVGFVLNFVNPFSSAIINGFLSGFLMSGGNLKAGLISAVTAGLMMAIGDKFANLALAQAGGTLSSLQKFGKALLEGIVGGAASAAMGGRFKDGFLGGFSGSLMGPLAGRVEDATGSQALGTAAAAVVGGTVAEIGGGRFGNGAISAAFADLYNRRGHRELRNTKQERELLAKGDARGYYESRARRGDAYARLALEVVDASSLEGLAANAKLLGFVEARRANGLRDGLPEDRSELLSQVNVDLAKTHADYVDRDQLGLKGLLSERQIQQYHEAYFRSVGLPGVTFGGSITPSVPLFRGVRVQLVLSGWCPACDPQ